MSERAVTSFWSATRRRFSSGSRPAPAWKSQEGWRTIFWASAVVDEADLKTGPAGQSLGASPPGVCQAGYQDASSLADPQDRARTTFVATPVPWSPLPSAQQ